MKKLSYYQLNKERCLEAQRRCRNKPGARERYLQDAKERSKKWYSKPENRLRRYEYNKQSWLRQLKKLEEKAGRPKPENCEICGENREKICFDHCHKTGKFRGWICDRCNTILGKVNDNKELLKSLIKYLNSSK